MSPPRCVWWIDRNVTNIPQPQPFSPWKRLILWRYRKTLLLRWSRKTLILIFGGGHDHLREKKQYSRHQMGLDRLSPPRIGALNQETNILMYICKQVSNYMETKCPQGSNQVSSTQLPNVLHAVTKCSPCSGHQMSPSSVLVTHGTYAGPRCAAHALGKAREYINDLV